MSIGRDVGCNIVGAGAWELVMWVEANGVMELVLRLGCCVELESLLGGLLVWVCWFG